MNLAKRTDHFYQAYGLSIHSDFEIADLVNTSAGTSDVRVRVGKLDESCLEVQLGGGITRSRYGVTARAAGATVTFHWRGVGKALICDGREVIIEPEDGVGTADLAPYFTGSILAVLLHQRRFTVLHASAVAIDGEAVAFVGDKGAGKSTFVAFLQSRGHKLLADDLVPVSFTDDQVCAIPGFPRISLWPDSVESIGIDPATLPKINRFVDKHSFRSERFSAKPIRLSRIYVLAADDDVRIEQLEMTEAFIEIVRNCYLGSYVDATGQTDSHFRNCSRLTRSVPVYRLSRRLDFLSLPRVSSLVEDHRQTLDLNCPA